MKVFRDIADFKDAGPTVVTTGTFDGVHLGHRKILQELIENARQDGLSSTLFTLYPHPRLVLNPDASIQLLNTLDERIELLSQTGLDNLIIYPFTKSFSRLTAVEYVRDILMNGLHARKVVVGYDHRFGKNREGNFDDLVELGHLYDFEVVKIGPKEIEGVNLSSTKIRNALLEGDLNTAHQYLGYRYFITGTVIEGKQLGRSLGFPTANVTINDRHKLLPKDGVYAVMVTLEGKKIKGMMNIGMRPTVESKGRSVEVHMFDFDNHIYGASLRIELVARMRNEIRFENLDQLREQLNKDKTTAQQVLEHEI